MVFSFVGEWILPMSQTGELHSQEGVWLLVLTCRVGRFTQAELGPYCRKKWQATFPKADAHWDWVQACGAYRGPGRCRVQFYLALNLLLFARKLKKKKRERLFPRQACPSGCESHARTSLAVRCN
jgi:hypothetical protein